MDQPLEMLGAAALVIALAGSGYLVFAGLQIRRFGRGHGAPAGDEGAPPVTILKPLHGSEPELEAALATFLVQDYRGAVQVVLGLQDPDDPARAVAERLRDLHPHADIVIVVDGREHGANRKVSNLVNMSASARHSILVLSDSDISVPPDYLRRVVAPLADPQIGVVTCAYSARALAGFWSELVAMQITYNFLPSVAVGVSLGLAKPCMGSTIALRGEVLSRIGGFERFGDVLADDYAMGQAARCAGFEVRVSDLLVTHGCAQRSPHELLAQELRWARTVRGIDAVGFLGSIVTHALVWALIGTALLQGAAVAVAVLVCAVLARLWMMRQVEIVSGASPGRWSLTPVRDILSFAVFVSSFFIRVVEWRGARFRVDRRGGLSDV